MQIKIPQQLIERGKNRLNNLFILLESELAYHKNTFNITFLNIEKEIITGYSIKTDKVSRVDFELMNPSGILS